MAEKNIEIVQEYGQKFKPLIQRISERVKNLKRGIEKGIINSKSFSSFVMRNNGDINSVSSKTAQVKMSGSLGTVTSISNQNVVVANKIKVTTDEIIINNHKLNNKLFEYTDLKMVGDNKEKLVTGLALETTVLTKSWEPDLKRYVMIRRPARFAMFSPEMNLADVPEDLNIDTEIEKEFKDLVDIESAAEKFNSFAEGGQTNGL